MISISDKTKCSGCFACYNACPVNCIKMLQDEEGFYYPEADAAKCINCGLCKKTCPILNPVGTDSNIRKVFICQNKSVDIRLDSTSGGVFSALAQYVLNRDGIVFGAEFGKDFAVRHGSCDKPEELVRFRGSKYVQSYVGNVYQQVRDYLTEGRWVLFTGTPCQVAGLSKFLGRKHKKLILMDIVCYSISSPGVWEQYLRHIEKSGKVKLKETGRLKFRDKSKYGYDYSLMAFYDKNENVLFSEGAESSQMLRSFVTNTSTRLSCYECQFKGTERVSDFTVWDCYNIYQYDKTMDDDKGSSHMMVHTQKGMDMLPELYEYLMMKEVDTNKAVNSEPAMCEPAKPGDMREAFFEEYKKGGDVFDIYFKDSYRVKGERALRRLLSMMGLYKKVKRILKR